jgi:GNAT superfamily N-acetyltransferase
MNPEKVTCRSCGSTFDVTYDVWDGRPRGVADFMGPKLSPGTENAIRTIAARNGYEMVGVVSIVDCDGDGYLTGLKVARAVRNEGIGTRLTRRCCEQGEQLGWDRIYLDTVTDKAASMFIGAGATKVTYDEMLGAVEDHLGDAVRGYRASDRDYECWAIELSDNDDE